MTYCSPYNETIKNKKTCYSINSLLKIARSWNKENKSKRKNIKLRKHRTKLWNRINNKIKGKCSNEWCWKEQPFVKELNDSTINNSHRPYKPQEWYKNERTWLNTYDIRNVMKQYQKKHKDFYFIGPVPIDFDYKFSDNNCVSNEICGIDTEELLTKKDKHKIGIIFNLDKHNESGSHWTALYTDLDKGTSYYFDSYGVYPPKEVEELMNRFKKQSEDKLKKKFKLYYNDIRHQYKNSECGMYSIHFIVQFLNKINFKKIIENIIFDDDINKLRTSLYYTPSQ